MSQVCARTAWLRSSVQGTPSRRIALICLGNEICLDVLDTITLQPKSFLLLSYFESAQFPGAAGLMDSLIWSGRFVLDRLCVQEVRSAGLSAPWRGCGAGRAGLSACMALGSTLLKALGSLKFAASVMAKVTVESKGLWEG